MTPSRRHHQDPRLRLDGRRSPVEGDLSAGGTLDIELSNPAPASNPLAFDLYVLAVPV
jgi:hypothetical protein